MAIGAGEGWIHVLIILIKYLAPIYKVDASDSKQWILIKMLEMYSSSQYLLITINY